MRGWKDPKQYYIDNLAFGIAKIGAAFFPKFEGEYPRIFQQVHQALRNQYVLTYQSSNTAHDGTFRKIKVDLVNPATNEPLPVKDEKGKPIKYQIVAKAGYTAPRAVE